MKTEGNIYVVVGVQKQFYDLSNNEMNYTETFLKESFDCSNAVVSQTLHISNTNTNINMNTNMNDKDETLTLDFNSSSAQDTSLSDVLSKMSPYILQKNLTGFGLPFNSIFGNISVVWYWR